VVDYFCRVAHARAKALGIGKTGDGGRSMGEKTEAKVKVETRQEEEL